VIERTFGVWKAKWRILDRKHLKYDVIKWVKIVTATMALHNFIRDSSDEDRDFTYWETVNEYEHHGDQAVEELEHTPYLFVHFYYEALHTPYSILISSRYSRIYFLSI